MLTVSFVSQNDVDAFKQGGPTGVSEVLRNAIIEVLGLRVKFIARAEGPAAPRRHGRAGARRADSRRARAAGARGARAGHSPRSCRSDRPAQSSSRAAAKPAVDAQGWAVAEIPQDEAPTKKHVPKPKAEPVASTEPARYGESVVRELLGANFIEEQAIAPKVVPRPAEGE